MLARGLLCRLAAEAPKTSTTDVAQLARLLQRSAISRNARSLPPAYALPRAVNTVFAEMRRPYATATATGSATEPTATVKKAVKKATAKKAAPKKTATRKKAAKKAAPKKKKTKAAAAKKTQKPKKVLTDEEKRKKLIKELKERALRQPVSKRSVAASDMFIRDALGGSEGRTTTRIGEVWAKFRALTPAEREHYNHLATEENAARAKQYKDWVHSHTAEEIRVANVARARLRRLFKAEQKKPPKNTAKIEDDRRVKKRTPFNNFYTERLASGDFKGIEAKEWLKLAWKEWKALTEAEQQKYETQA
ncbi:uncharacterized protein EI97DRAFT_436836 [Westerdykella ornata]|uniref:HMG box domain-containing protein n=1 Tax=Westerdykella ornata TaxID=318751 RepID=A0A6A6JAE4_WESOR|nr:uncharacterized protein EI97DRAFT_436836 [Westerdykella ornata]KAF2272596.1 hypothetical protein EI97DRAFT_436836 [Westerdykella ornata]